MGFASSWSNSVFYHFCTLLSVILSLWLAASVASSCLPDQRFVLLQLKKGFSHSDLPYWLPDTDCCHGWEGVSCDVSGHVTALDLNNRNIEGNLSAVIFNLTSLRYLNLAYNDFSLNEIPHPGFERLTRLTHLNLSYSNFNGQIPIGIANLTNLISLDLSTNWTLILDPNLCTLVSNLSNLRELHLDGVAVSENGTDWCGALSEFVPLLQVLSMERCNLFGRIEPSLSRLNSLAVIHLSENRFSFIPDFFANFSLKDLRLSDCFITGWFPTKTFHILSLTILDLSMNEDLLGTIPHFPLESSLKILSLHATKFSGRIPDSIGNPTNLTQISLSSCNFSGQIPSSITKLTKLEFLDLSGNSLSGLIPQGLFDLPNLVALNLSGNMLSGELKIEESTPIWSFPLKDLRLFGNQLNGSIPQVIYKFSTLEILILSSNQFTGPIPNSIFSLSGLRWLYLESNKFNGIVDLSLLQHLPNLTDLYLSDNQLSVIEDVSHQQLKLPIPKIRALELASCNLSQIPRLIGYQNDLVVLNLSNNQLHGVVPSWLWEKFTSRQNDITGGGIGQLDLSRNKFIGVENVPQCSSTLSSCRFLFIIDLSYNKIKGALPLVSCEVLDYSNNEFSAIPSNYTLYLKKASTIKLSTNLLTGEIPSSIYEISYLDFLDLSNNSLSGDIPTCILGAPYPSFLNLASNKLHGIIPRNITMSCGHWILD